MSAEPYSELAAGYDFVMAHVDYDAWAAYIFDLLRRHGSDVETVVELGGGTGSLARRLQPLGDYRYVLSDGSSAMLNQARQKIGSDPPIRYVQADFTTVDLGDVELDDPADAVVLVYDGLNYLLEEEEVANLFSSIHDLLREDGIAIVDQSTPANSQKHGSEFVDEGSTDHFSYVRENEYNPETGYHETIFDITVDGRSCRERHVQRAYSRHEVRQLLSSSPLTVEASYDEFTTEPANDESYRVHWVLRRTDDRS